MTMPWGSTEEPDVIETMPESVPVHVVSSDAPKRIAPEFGQWRTVIVSNVIGAYSATPGAQRLLNRSQRRRRAHIIVNSSVAAQNVQDGIIVGSREAIISGQAATIGGIGGYLQIGDSLTYEAQQELWVCYPVSNTATVYVTVCDEVYASGE